MSNTIKDPSEYQKKGALSNEDKAFIKKNAETMSVQDIANALNRRIYPVEKYYEKLRAKKKLDVTKESEQELLAILHSRPFWLDIRRQFTLHERELYEYHWVRYSLQFSSDITHAEESQICKVIELEIMMTRNMNEKSKVEKDIDKLDRLLAVEFAKDPTIRDPVLIENIQAQLTAIRSSQLSRAKEYNELLDKHGKLHISLKSTRNQRLIDLEQGKISFLGWMKRFSDPEYRAELSKQAELDKLAMLKEYDRLSEYHVFSDGLADKPVLNSDTVLLEQNTKEGTNESEKTL